MEMNEQRQAAEQQADPRIDLAVQRTELAEDRTLLAWLRTALGLMGAGAAFDKGARLLHEERLAAGTALIRNSHLVGLSVTGVVSVLLVLVLWQHRRKQAELARIKGGTALAFPSTTVACVLVILLGVAVFGLLVMTG